MGRRRPPARCRQEARIASIHGYRCFRRTLCRDVPSFRHRPACAYECVAGWRLRCCRINEKRSGLEHEHGAWAEISATAVPVGGRRSDHEHLATLKCEFPQRVVGCPVCGWIAVVVMKELQNLPKARDKGHVIRNRRVGFEERSAAAVLHRRDRRRNRAYKWLRNPRCFIATKRMMPETTCGGQGCMR
jgi:hypothetical protein